MVHWAHPSSCPKRPVNQFGHFCTACGCDSQITLLCRKRPHLASAVMLPNNTELSLLPSLLWHCCLGGKKGIRPVKKWWDGGGGHWLVRLEWHRARWSVCLPLLIFPCTIKSRSSFLAPAHLGGPRKRVVKRLCVCVCVLAYCFRDWNYVSFYQARKLITRHILSTVYSYDLE